METNCNHKFVCSLQISSAMVDSTIRANRRSFTALLPKPSTKMMRINLSPREYIICMHTTSDNNKKIQKEKEYERREQKAIRSDKERLESRIRCILNHIADRIYIAVCAHNKNIPFLSSSLLPRRDVMITCVCHGHCIIIFS